MTDIDKPTLFAQFVAKDGSFDDLLVALRELVPVAEDDPGVEVYRLHASADRTSVWFYEQYADAAAGKAHREDPRLRAVLAACAPLLAERRIVDGTLLGAKA